jgi:hypothetical protein
MREGVEFRRERWHRRLVPFLPVSGLGIHHHWKVKQRRQAVEGAENVEKIDRYHGAHARGKRPRYRRRVFGDD